MKITSIVGARPQFIKLAPLNKYIQKNKKTGREKEIEHTIVHTGQHYDFKMNKIFFDELDIPEPDFNLEVGSGSHAFQTGEMMKRAENILIELKPDWVLVYGDTNSTLAATLTSTKLHIRTAHVESGLRSYNTRMPEEINRVLTDRCADILFCPTENAVKNLSKEGFTNIINEGKLIGLSAINPQMDDTQFPLTINVGDIMYDALLMSLEIAEKKSTIMEKLALKPKEYFLATLHRAENTDDKERLRIIMDAYSEIAKDQPVIFPVHPRTENSLGEIDIPESIIDSVRITPPVSYFDMLILEKNASKILTDSGGVQKEAYLLNIPCVTLRDETEWVETVDSGINILTGVDKDRILQAARSSQSGDRINRNIFGDGATSEKIVKILSELSDSSRS